MRWLAVLLLLSLGLAGCSDDPDPEPMEKPDDGGSDPEPDDPAPETHHVDIASFQLPDLTIHEGDTVVWTNQDSAAHTATSDDGSTFDSGRLDQGQSFSWTATAAGTFDYHCTFHSSMTATITVTAA